MSATPTNPPSVVAQSTNLVLTAQPTPVLAQVHYPGYSEYRIHTIRPPIPTTVPALAAVVFRVPVIPIQRAIPVIAAPAAWPRILPNVRGQAHRNLFAPPHMSPAQQTRPQQQATAAATPDTVEPRLTRHQRAAALAPIPVDETLLVGQQEEEESDEASDFLGVGGMARVMRVRQTGNLDVARKTFNVRKEDEFKYEVTNLRKLREIFPIPVLYPPELMGYKVRYSPILIFSL